MLPLSLGQGVAGMEVSKDMTNKCSRYVEVTKEFFHILGSGAANEFFEYLNRVVAWADVCSNTHTNLLCGKLTGA